MSARWRVGGARAVLPTCVGATLALSLLGSAPGAAAASEPQGRLPQPLHSVRGTAPAIVDRAGRQVLLRGVNVNQLGDYRRGNPALPTVIPLREADFRRISRLGFNSVRLILSWSALEPKPGAFDRDYVARIHRAVRRARRYDLYVVLDMHQDAWGKFIATPPGTSCPPPLEPAIGWDGAPRWATITDGLTSCRLGIRELSPAVAQAFQSFWLDRDGIQSALVRTWARLAREFAAEPAIAGYDLLNEPNPGFTIGATELTLLGDFYRRAITAIRRAESRAPHGRHHIAFFEPIVIWSGFGVDAVPPPTFTDDPSIVFAPHLYAGSITVDRAVLDRELVSIEQGFRLAAAAAGSYGVTFWSGEYGWFGDPRENLPEIREYARQEDAHVIGGAWWSWKQACGDPHVVGTPGGAPTGVSPSLNRYQCPEQEPLGIPRGTRRTLSRTYPRAAPGRIVSLHSDPASGAFRLVGSDPDRAGSCRLRVWAPGRERPGFDARRVRALRERRVPGGWLVAGCASGRYELRRSG